MADETEGMAEDAGQGMEAPAAENPHGNFREAYLGASASRPAPPAAAQPAAAPAAAQPEGVDWQKEAIRYQQELETMRQRGGQPHPQAEPAKSKWEKPEYLAGPKDAMVKQYYDRIHMQPELLTDPELSQQYMAQLNLVQRHAFERAVALVQEKEAFNTRSYTEPYEWAADLLAEGTPAYEAVQRIADAQAQRFEQRIAQMEEERKQERVAMIQQTWEDKFQPQVNAMPPAVQQLMAELRFGAIDWSRPDWAEQAKQIVARAKAWTKQFGLDAPPAQPAAKPPAPAQQRPPTPRPSATAGAGNGRGPAPADDFRSAYLRAVANGR